VISHGYKLEVFMKIITEIYIGIDISKDTCDVHMYPLNRSFTIKNSRSDMNKLLKEFSSYKIVRIACEATGGYEKLLFKVFKAHNYDLWIVDPRRIKGFIIASGCKSKTDKSDAQKIAEFAFKNVPEYSAIKKTETQEFLLALVNRKSDLMRILAAEKTRLIQPSHSPSVANIQQHINFLEKGIKKIEKHIQKLIQEDNVLNKKSCFLESIPGIGKGTAALLLSFVPELGHLANKQISALIGLAPYDHQSGKYDGKKKIYGGRSIPRNALYMCAVTAIRYNAILKSFYERLIAGKKPFKVAIVAVMHKLIIFANSLLKKGEMYTA
jgi:transposase